MYKLNRFLKKRPHTIFLVILSIIAAVYILPLLITITNSLMSQNEVGRNYSTSGDIFHAGEKFITMNFIPESVTLEQYSSLLLQSPVYLNMFWNSIKIAIPVAAGQLFISSIAAYAFTVLRFRGKEIIFFIYIIVMLLPLQVTLMPNYVVADLFHMTDSYWAIILPGIFNPFGVFLLRQFMKMIPEAYMESAKMDGAGHIRIFSGIILPMVKSGLAAIVMLTFIDYWNLVDQAVIFIQDSQAQPLSLFLARISMEQIGVAFAGSCFYVAPILIILFYGQNYLKDGIRLSGLKG
jgi:multiple sugar transport system permease protein